MTNVTNDVTWLFSKFQENCTQVSDQMSLWWTSSLPLQKFAVVRWNTGSISVSLFESKYSLFFILIIVFLQASIAIPRLPYFDMPCLSHRFKTISRPDVSSPTLFFPFLGFFHFLQLSQPMNVGSTIVVCFSAPFR